MEPQYIVFKKSRAYEAGPGYQNYQPSSREAAEAHAAALSAENVVGFEALPYVAYESVKSFSLLPPKLMSTSLPPQALPATPQQIATFACLTTKEWKKDKGFPLVITQNPGTRMFKDQVLGPGRPDAVAYWRKEKADRPLWKLLLLDMGAHQRPQTLEYFGLPADTHAFLDWVYNHVEHADREAVPGMSKGFAAGLDQMNHFPYAALYQVWLSEDDAQRAARVPEGNVLVYLGRITETGGKVLLEW